MNRTANYIAISSFALLVVLAMQLDWILKTEAYKEEYFNEKANIVLARTTEVLSSDRETSHRLELGLQSKDRRKIDSLFRHFMKYYDLNSDYSFEVIRATMPVPDNTGAVVSVGTGTGKPACYRASLNEKALANGWELKLNFPDREELVMGELGMPFFTSVVLILIVLILFWRTAVIFNRDKKISEFTTDFLNNMTHEFKTPLTSISLAGNMILKEATDKQEREIKYNSEIILEENEKLRLQVEQVLSMTALERGEIPVQKTELDLHQLIRDFLRSFAIQLENSKVHLHLKLDAEQMVIMGDKTHLTNAFRNLIDNAVKYSGKQPDITIQTWNTDKSIIIIVSDSGIGIEKEYQKKVFEKYFRVPTGDVHDVKGFGLGLSYVRKIIELHDGMIELESEKGKGSTFKIILPNE